jgi:carboxynorspermidine decarboxylase
MLTQSTGARHFAAFDLSRVPSPCFVVDEVALRQNLEILQAVSKASGAEILLALKAFSMWSLAPLVRQYISGTCASGLWEAQLAAAHYGGQLTSYAPAFKGAEFDEIAHLSDHIVFNSAAQVARFGAQAQQAGACVGLRINPEHSEGEVEKYDPCAAGSRLGQPISQLAELPEAVTGLHMHSLCEQGFAPLARTIEAIEPFLIAHKEQLTWLNLGGGHLITKPDYDREGLVDLLTRLRDTLDVQVYLELGTSVAFDAGILVGEVLDVTQNDGPIAIVDISATCHMPDVLEAPYRPALLGEPTSGGQSVVLGGPSCLAGDVIGAYAFADLPQAGERLAFLDQAHYSMVKTSTFNGIALPSIAIWNSDSDALRLVKQFDYRDFETRLS